MMEIVRTKDQTLYHMWGKKELPAGDGAHTWRNI